MGKQPMLFFHTFGGAEGHVCSLTKGDARMKDEQNELIENARSDIRSALCQIEKLMDESQEAHTILQSQAIGLSKTLKSARRNLLDFVDTQTAINP